MHATETWAQDHLGPLEVLAFTLPADDDAPWAALLAAVDAHAVRILDLELLLRHAENEIEFVTVEDLDHVPAVLATFEGAYSGLLDDDDALAVLPHLADGEVAVVLLVEHVGLLGTLERFEAAGSRLLLEGIVVLEDLEEALDTNDDPDDDKE